MNKNFNLQDQVADMNQNIRRTILFSLVGSINATLINEASRIIDDLGEEFDNAEPKDIVRSMMGNEVGPQEPEQRVSDIRLLYALGETWRKDLQMQANDNTQGTLISTLNFMTGPPRPIKIVGSGMLAAAGIVRSEEKRAAAREKQRELNQLKADALSAKRGHIEWIIDKVFSAFDVGNDGDYWEGLSEMRREQLTQKAFTALSSAFEQACDNVDFGRRGEHMLGIGDAIILRDHLIPLFNAAFINETVAEKKVRRVKAEA